VGEHLVQREYEQVVLEWVDVLVFVGIGRLLLTNEEALQQAHSLLCLGVVLASEASGEGLHEDQKGEEDCCQEVRAQAAQDSRLDSKGLTRRQGLTLLCDDHVLLDELEGSLGDLREVEAWVIVFFHYIPELQFLKVEEADVAFVSLILFKHYLDLGLTEGIRVTVHNTNNLADDNALLLGMVNVL